MLAVFIKFTIAYIQQYWLCAIVQLFNIPLYFYLFTIKQDLKFLKLSSISCILFGVGYWGMSAWSGVVFSVFSLVYLLISYLYKKHKVNNILKYGTFISVAVLIILINLYYEKESLFANKDFVPILCITASLIHAYIYFCREINSKKSRWLFVLSHSLLITYELIIVLPLFALVDICGLVSNIRELKAFYLECAKSKKTLN